MARVPLQLVSGCPDRNVSRLTFRAAAASFALAAFCLAGTSARGGTIIFTDNYEDGIKFTNPNPAAYVVGSIGDVGTSISPTHVLQLSNYPLKNGALYTLPDTWALGTYTLSFWHMRQAGYEGANWAVFAYDAPSNPLQVFDGYWSNDIPTSWEQITTSTTITGDSPALGKSVQLVFDQSNGSNGNVTSLIYLDNVSLSFTPAETPEIDPAGFGSVFALVAGSLGLLERRRPKAA